MPSDGSEDFQRLHPTSLLFLIGQVLRQFLLPALVVLVLGRGERYEVWIAVFALPAAAAALVRYLTYRYRLDDDELVIRQGVLRRNERHVPFERIQNIDTSRGVLHRALGVAEVKLQTASGSEPEAVMRVLSLDAVEAMRAHVFDRRGRPGARAGGVDPTSADPAAQVLAEVPTDDLVRYGIISNRGLVALAALTGVVWQADVDPVSWITDRIPGLDTVQMPEALLVGAAMVLAAVVVLRMLSVAWSLVSFHGFTLTRDDDELVARYGLLTQRTVTIPVHRIQLVTIEENPLHRAFRRATIRARTAGSAGGEQEAGRHDWLAPVVPRDRLEALLTAVDEELSPAGLEWRPLAPRAVWRAVRKPVLGLLLVGLPPAAFQPWLLVFTPAVAALVGLFAALRVRHTFWATGPHGVWLRTGWLTRTTRAVRHASIQTVARTESPFDRRATMAGIEVDTANSGGGGPAIRIPYLERGDADHLLARLAYRAAATPFRW